MARFRFGAFPGGDPWQLFRFMRSRRGLGREKRRFVATYRRHVSKMSWLRQDMRAMHPKSPANGRSRMHGAQILPGRGPFRCARPSNHAQRTNLAIPRCSFERFDLSRTGAVLAVRALPSSCALSALLGLPASSPTCSFFSPASLSSRPRRGRNSGIVSFAAENMAL